MPNSHDLVFLVDVDNTLLDNDGVRARLEAGISRAVGEASAARFWELYEQVRSEIDYVDLPEVMERFGRELEDIEGMGLLSDLLRDFPFPDCLYPGALEALSHLDRVGTAVILSDGDQMYQRHKIRSAGIEAAVAGRVLVYIHKEDELDDVRARYPARHYVILDDKPRIHTAMKRALGEAVTTVLVRQGKYALAEAPAEPVSPDLVLKSIADATGLTADGLRAAASG